MQGDLTVQTQREGGRGSQRCLQLWRAFDGAAAACLFGSMSAARSRWQSSGEREEEERKERDGAAEQRASASLAAQTTVSGHVTAGTVADDVRLLPQAWGHSIVGVCSRGNYRTTLAVTSYDLQIMNYTMRGAAAGREGWNTGRLQVMRYAC
jgi:hypothetical protein